MIDLNNPDTYSVQDYGGGNLLYQDTSTGAMYDPSDLSTPLSASAVAQYGATAGTSGAITPSSGTAPSQSSLTAPASSGTVNSPGSGGINLSGMSGMFTAIGSAFASVIAPPKAAPTTGQPLVYNAALGTYVPASATGASLTNLSNTPMWIILGGVAIVVFLIFMMDRKKG